MVSTDTLNAEPLSTASGAATSSPEVEVLVAGITFGPFTETKLRERLAEDLVALNDKARLVGSGEWSSLEDVLGRLAATPIPEPPPEESTPEPPPEVAAIPEPPEPEPAPAAEAIAATENLPPPPPPEPEAPKPESIVPLQPEAPKPNRFSSVKTAGLKRLSTGPLPAAPRGTSSLIKGRAKSGNLLGPSAPGTEAPRGLRSQILARTSQDPLKLSSAPPTTGVPISSGTLRLPPRNTTGPLSSPKPASRISPPQAPAAVPPPPASPHPGFRFQASRPASGETEVKPPPPPAAPAPPSSPHPGFRFQVPRPALDEETEVEPASQADEPATPEIAFSAETSLPPHPPAISFSPEMDHTETIEPEPPVEEHASPATRTVSVAALASGTVSLPPPPLPARPAEQRPAVDPDSVVTVHIPARRTQLIKTLPGQAVRPKTDLLPKEPTSNPAGTAEAKFARLPEPPPPPPAIGEGIKKSITSPLPAPTRSSALKSASSSQTLASVAAAPPPSKGEAVIKVRRGMGDASSMAATTLLPSKAISADSENPSALIPSEGAFDSQQTLDSQEIEDEEDETDEPATGQTALIEVRRAALKLARLQRQRQGIIYAVAALLLLILLGFGIYHYAFSSRDNGKTIPAAAAPAPIPTPTPAPVVTPPPAAAPATPPSMAPPPDTTPPKPATTSALLPGLKTTTAPPPATASTSPPPAAPVAVITPPPAPVSVPAPPPPPPDPKVLAHVTQGKADQAKGDLDGALGEFTQALILDPKNSEAYSFRAAVRLAKGDYDGAITDDNMLLTLSPSNSNGFCQRGFIKQSKGDKDGAIADYTRAVTLDPQACIAFYNRGMIEEEKDQNDAALADFNRTLDINAQLAGAYYHRGNTKMNKNDLDGAIADYTRALQINPHICLALCNRASAEQDSGNLDIALNDYNQAIALAPMDPKIAMAYYNRGLIKEQRSDFEGCIDDSTQALELDPTKAQAYYNRGVALQAKGNFDAATNDLQKFSELAPKDPYSDYAHLYLWIIGTAQGHKTVANQELSVTILSNWNAEPSQLTSKIASFLLGQLTEPDLMTAATSPDPKKNQGQHCEVWYFDGIKKLLAGDQTSATSAFNQCVTTGEKDYCEYILAQAQLQNLRQSKLSVDRP